MYAWFPFIIIKKVCIVFLLLLDYLLCIIMLWLLKMLNINIALLLLKILCMIIIILFVSPEDDVQRACKTTMNKRNALWGMAILRSYLAAHILRKAVKLKHWITNIFYYYFYYLFSLRYFIPPGTCRLSFVCRLSLLWNNCLEVRGLRKKILLLYYYHCCFIHTT